MAPDSTESKRIPLFPLEVVLFPGAPLPLHIFEPRYKEMIGWCLERREEFGLVLERSGELAAIGCAAEILKVIQRYPDGRMDILTIGRTRFQMEELIDEKAYHEARVVFLADEAGMATPPQQVEGLVSLYQECHRAVHGRSAVAPEERKSLAYQIALELPLELETKQALLELRSESARQEYLTEFLTQWLPHLQRVQQVKARAGGNGHG